jgi:hypothetical protein
MRNLLRLLEIREVGTVHYNLCTICSMALYIIRENETKDEVEGPMKRGIWTQLSSRLKRETGEIERSFGKQRISKRRRERVPNANYQKYEGSSKGK